MRLGGCSMIGKFPAAAVLAALTLAAAAGCARSLPREVLTDMPTASVTFSKGYLGTDKGALGNTIYEYYADDECRRRARIPLTAITAASRTEMIPATRRVFFSGNANFYFTGGITGGSTISCTGFAGFAPKAGHRYWVVVKTNDRNCTYIVRDLDTERPPPDLEFFDALIECPGFMQRKARPLPPVERREPAPTPTQT